MLMAFKDDVPALSTVPKWAAEFKRRESVLEITEQSGRLANATIKEDIVFTV